MKNKEQYLGDLIFMIFFLTIVGFLIFVTIPAKAEEFYTLPHIELKKPNRPYRIAIVDTGLNNQNKYPLCNNGHISFIGNGTNDEVGHGTEMTDIIDSQAKLSDKEYCYVIIKALGYTKGVRGIDDSRFVDAIKAVSEMTDIDIVNISVSGRAYLPEEVKYIKSMLDRKVLIVVAAGNDGQRLEKKFCFIYPACDDERVFVVGRKDTTVSNYGSQVDVMMGGRYFVNGKEIYGTSPSTAFTTGLILRLIK